MFKRKPQKEFDDEEDQDSEMKKLREQLRDLEQQKKGIKNSEEYNQNNNQRNSESFFESPASKITDEENNKILFKTISRNLQELAYLFSKLSE